MGAQIQHENQYFLLFLRGIVGVLLIVLGLIVLFGFIEIIKLIF